MVMQWKCSDQEVKEEREKEVGSVLGASQMKIGNQKGRKTMRQNRREQEIRTSIKAPMGWLMSGLAWLGILNLSKLKEKLTNFSEEEFTTFLKEMAEEILDVAMGRTLDELATDVMYERLE